jgi:hypothetical protein
VKEIKVGKIYELRGRFKKKYRFNYEKFSPYIFVQSIETFPSTFGTKRIVRHMSIGTGVSIIQETIYEYMKEIYKEVVVDDGKKD